MRMKVELPLSGFHEVKSFSCQRRPALMVTFAFQSGFGQVQSSPQHRKAFPGARAFYKPS